MTTIKIIGASMSTFTRTIRMSLDYFKVPYEQVQVFPHSEEAKNYTPYGKIPILLIPGREDPMIETSVMRTYIDHVYGEKSALPPLTPTDFEDQLTVNLWIGLVSDHIFKNLIFGIAKPREFMEKRGETEELIQARLKKPMETAETIFKALDKTLHSQPFICGQRLTWADLFLYPCMADLFSLPEATVFKQWSPKLWAWYQHFEALDLAKNTYLGTVAQQRSLL